MTGAFEDRPASGRYRAATALAWTGLVVGVIAVVLESVLTICRRMADGHSFVEGLAFLLSFFTIWGNIALICVYGAVLGLFSGPFRKLATPSASTGALLTILLVAIVYHLLLARFEHLAGLRALANLLLHTFAPAIMVLWWLARPGHGRLTAIDPAGWTVFPLVYLAFALGQSRFTGWIPYPFLDYRDAGWPAVMITCAVIAIAFMIGAYLIYAIDTMLASTSPQTVQ